MKICIVTIIHNEHRYIEEFIEFYINLGICKFFIYEDWNSISHKDIMDKYGDIIQFNNIKDIFSKEEIDKYKNMLRHGLIWNDFYNKYKDEYDGCLFIDADEFLDCTKEEFLNEIESHLKCKTITYTWRIMTASGHIKDPNPGNKYSLIDTYKDYIDESKYINTKQLIILKNFKFLNHFMVPHVVWGGPDERFISNIKLRHYLTKSWEEYKERLFKRGEACSAWWTRKIESFFEINEDLAEYKDTLMEEVKNLEYKYNTIDSL